MVYILCVKNVGQYDHILHKRICSTFKWVMMIMYLIFRLFLFIEYSFSLIDLLEVMLTFLSFYFFYNKIFFIKVVY